MDKEQLIRIFEKGDYKISGEKPLSNGTGIQFLLNNGGVVNLWNSGKVTVQGKDKVKIESVLGIKAGEAAERPPMPSSKVFVVYGHDVNARNELEAMLRRWKLDPIILDQMPSEGTTLIEKLESYYDQVSFAVVLATPDDEGFRKNHPEEKSYRARQNVVLELGMLLALLGRRRVAVLLKDQETMERPSDIQGLIYIPFKNDIAKEAGLILAKEMVAVGYDINVARV